MTRNEKIFYLVLSIILIVLFFLSINNTFLNRNNVIYDISIIIDESNDDNWKLFKSGVEKASDENNVDINFVTLYEDYHVVNQTHSIKREITNGTDALIISPTSPEIISQELSNMKVQIPTIFINNELLNAEVKNFVAIDDLDLIKKFAKTICESNRNKKCIIITNNLNAQNLTKRNEIIISTLKEENVKYESFYYKDLNTLDEYLNTIKFNSNEYFLIGLNESNLLNISYFFQSQELESLPNIYGLGFNNEIIKHMENKIIHGIIAPDYYGAGYLSIKEAISAINHNTEPSVVLSSKIVFNDEIFSDENKMLLFPIQ